MTTRSAADDARDLPREPTTPWIRGLAAGMIAVWLLALVWQVMVLPEQVPTHFDSSGEPDGWSTRTVALAFAALGPLVIVLTIPLTSLFAIRAPEYINGPNKQWWTATGPRLRRYERLMREDLWLITVLTLALLVAMQVGIVNAAQSPDGRMPQELLFGGLALFGLGMVLVLLRMFSGGRYSEQPDLT